MGVYKFEMLMKGWALGGVGTEGTFQTKFGLGWGAEKQIIYSCHGYFLALPPVNNTHLRLEGNTGAANGK